MILYLNRTSGLKQNVCRDKGLMSELVSATVIFMTWQNSIEISDVRVQLPQWRLAVHLCVWQYLPVWGNGCTHYFLSQYWANQSTAAAVEVNSALVCMTVFTSVGKWLHTLLSHPILGEPSEFSRGMLTNKHHHLREEENCIEMSCWGSMVVFLTLRSGKSFACLLYTSPSPRD